MRPERRRTTHTNSPSRTITLLRGNAHLSTWSAEALLFSCRHGIIMNHQTSKYTRICSNTLQKYHCSTRRAFATTLHPFVLLAVRSSRTGCGTKITKAAWKGVRDTTRTSSYQWPAQGLPSVQDWIRRKSLTKALSLQTANRLIRPLGQWLLRKRSVGALMPQLSVCTRKWGLIRSIIPCPRSPQPKCLDEIRPFSRDADSWYSCPPKGLRSKVRTTSCGLRDTVQVAQQPSR
jgi:hypothetical protein